MVNTIVKMYITLSAPIIAGCLNMILCKLKILEKYNIPMDCKKNFIDGKRIFGDNKTWKGFFGYIILNVLCSILLGAIWNISNLNGMNYFFLKLPNTIYSNLAIGILLGLGYSIFELPNSFLKRRLNIEPGKTPNRINKIFLIFLDQADSVIGCCTVLSLFYQMTFGFYIMYILLGAFTHIVFNMVLYFLGLRKNMF